MTDDQFSKAFKDIVPESPAPDGWAAGALRRRRNRNITLAGMAGVLALALAVPVGLNLGDDPRIVANPAESSSETPTPLQSPSPELPAPAAPTTFGAAACFDEAGQLVQGNEQTQLRDGAVRAWLCGDASAENSAGTVGPLEGLETGVDQIYQFVDSQPELDIAAIMCTAEYSLAYRVVLEYGDGSTEVVNGETHGCQTINYGTTYREGGVEFLDVLKGLWRDQRSGADTPTELQTNPPCQPASSMLVPALKDTLFVFLCADSPSGNMSGQSPLDPYLAAGVKREIESNSVKGQPAGPGNAWLTMVDGWGDWLQLTSPDRGESFWYTDAEGVTWTWAPSPELKAELQPIMMDEPSEIPVDPPVDQPVVEPTPDETVVDPTPDGSVTPSVEPQPDESVPPTLPRFCRPSNTVESDVEVTLEDPISEGFVCTDTLSQAYPREIALPSDLLEAVVSEASTESVVDDRGGWTFEDASLILVTDEGNPMIVHQLSYDIPDQLAFIWQDGADLMIWEVSPGLASELAPYLAA
ncbi:hypothetical protein LKO27_00600 [Tessaracoccus sp. OS52]|uniref:hypothetical protein n=1 Tax=Tessaracoccus sp. OS52 TaxID=2886691 RepID=UPI001D11C250|nr:hypothetical protein [Tessaracoccus sp. OS52]MCC2591930.1 hypothetical protein [Tessaracoccus sp. OS52]